MARISTKSFKELKPNFKTKIKGKKRKKRFYSRMFPKKY